MLEKSKRVIRLDSKWQEFDFKPVGDEGIPLEQIQFELRVSGLFKWPSISYQLV